MFFPHSWYLSPRLQARDQGKKKKKFSGLFQVILKEHYRWKSLFFQRIGVYCFVSKKEEILGSNSSFEMHFQERISKLDAWYTRNIWDDSA